MEAPEKRRVAIITARGGSKRIPRKNIKLFLGKPIIAYSIQAALDAHCFDEIMVSTDDEEIADVAQKYGASVPFFRSEATSNDFSGTADVLLEVLSQYQRQSVNFHQACCIYPTAPFLTPEVLIKGLALMEEYQAESLIPVAEFPSSIWRSFQISGNYLERIWPENEEKRSQDLRNAYYDAGQFYWFQIKPFLNSKKLLTEKTIPLILQPAQVQDIDTPSDWIEAESKYQLLFRRRENS